MTTKTTDRIIEGKNYRQHILDKIELESSEAETLIPESNKADYIRVLEEKAKTFKSMIDEMIEKSRNMEDDAKAEFEKENAKLQQQYKETVSRLNEVRQASGDAWKELYDGAVNAWRELAVGIKKAVNTIK